MSFFGCTAIVTGGASGIGLAISERLAADGISVALPAPAASTNAATAIALFIVEPPAGTAG